ncbi:Trm112 family protein [Gammaproteobacteria bacterium]|nr:Trm112 family protein [Gammaproteobacteria bacterium]
MTILDQKLLDILICPISKSSLKYDKENNELISEESGLAYPVRDGIPVMLPEEARKI